MTTTVLKAAVAACLVAGAALVGGAAAAHGPKSIELRKLASFATSTTAGVTAAEIVAYDRRSRRAFAINSTENQLVALDLSHVGAGTITEVAKLSFAAYGAGLNGVAIHDGLVAVAVENADKTQPGVVVLFRAGAVAAGATAPPADATVLTVGALPDMVTFTKNGRWLLVANEGEPNSYNQPTSVDPVGSISIVDLRRGVARATVATAGFAAFDSQRDALRAQGVRIFGPGASVSQDLEPEYITTRGRTAWVTLQEANALAVVDIPTATVTRIVPLGAKRHDLSGNGLDPSDQDGVNRIANWPVVGLYQPDAIASYVAHDGQVYLVTANEGDARDYTGFSEELRVNNAGYVLDPTAFPNAATLKQNANLGRLTVTRATGDTDGDGDFDRIEAYGARSISIWSATGDLVWDSGDQLEQITLARFPDFFNADHTGLARDNRSDNKGPEPEGVAVGRVAGRSYAFVGLERIGGLMAFDVTNPGAPTFVAYANERGPDATADVARDRGAEGIEFVRASDSPTCNPLVLVGNEVSRSVAVYEVVRTERRGRGPKCERDAHEERDERADRDDE